MPKAVEDSSSPSPRVVPTESNVFNTLLPLPPSNEADEARAAAPARPTWLTPPQERRYSTRSSIDAGQLAALGLNKKAVRATLAELGPSPDGPKEARGRAETAHTLDARRGRP